MTNVLKISLQGGEERISCIITAYYEVALEEEMIVRALANQNYHWLMFVWAFDKNYVGPRNRDDSHFINFEELFGLIKEHHLESEPTALKKIKVALDWKIISRDNVLIALLSHHLDEMAITYMGYYSHLLDKDLFIYCIKHGNI